jgi:hypothetical protein
MKKFDLKKAILENKATFFSSLTEGYDEFKRMDKGSKGVTAKNKGEEEVYGAGVKKGEEIEKKKMKESQLRAKIKEMIVAEMALDIDTMEDAPESEVDFLAELEGMLGEDDSLENLSDYELIELANDEGMEEMIIRDGDGGLVNRKEIISLLKSTKDYATSLSEVEKDEDEEEEIEVTDDFSTEEPQGKSKIDVTQNADAELTGDKKMVQDNLEAALEAAKALGDDKLVTQIGNSLTFFTKQHVVN